MLATSLAFLTVSFFPRVEDPWPESIGLGFPFTLAGAGGILASTICANVPEGQRDRAIRWGGLAGFYFGVGIYFISLLIQVGFRS